MSVTSHQVVENRTRRRLSLGPHCLLASGGAGTVYAHPDDPSLCVKLYATAEQRKLHETKVSAMLDKTPDNVRTRSGVIQLAWPQEAVLDTGGFAGFVMPRLPLADTWSFDVLIHPKSRRSHGAPDNVKFRLTLLRNLAAVLIGLHAKGHYAIDLQPKNVFAYRWAPGVSAPSSGFVALIDCDGFSIAGGATSHPAGLLMEEYACPVAFDHALTFDANRVVGFERQQDLWAFAVLAFRLLNNGLAPWDSIPKPHLTGSSASNAPASTIERIVEIDRVYAFSAKPNFDFTPPRSSRHEWFAPELTALFERTFLASHNEPSLKEWLDLLTRLLAPTGACASDPDHWKLGPVCGECEISARAPAPLPAPTAPSPPRPAAGSSPSRQPPPPPAPPLPPRGPQQVSSAPVRGRSPMWAIAALGVGAYLAFSPAMPWRKKPPMEQTGPAPAAETAPQPSPAGPPLVHQSVRPLQWYSLLMDFPSTDAYWNSTGAQNELNGRQALLEAEGASTILRCDYDAGNYTQFEYYWKDRRSAQASPAVLSSVQPDHPYLRIREARRDCPGVWDGGDTGRDWSALTRAGRARRAAGAAAAEPQATSPTSSSAAEAPRQAPERSPASPAQSSRTVSAEDAEGARRFVGEWRGNYICNQGPTGVTVRLDTTPNGDLSGVFEFYPLSINPQAPSGAYRIRAAYSATNNALLLEPVSWIRRPPGFEMVGARLRAPPDARVLNGAVSARGCSSISLSRN